MPSTVSSPDLNSFIQLNCPPMLAFNSTTIESLVNIPDDLSKPPKRNTTDENKQNLQFKNGRKVPRQTNLLEVSVLLMRPPKSHVPSMSKESEFEQAINEYCQNIEKQTKLLLNSFEPDKICLTSIKLIRRKAENSISKALNQFLNEQLGNTNPVVIDTRKQNQTSRVYADVHDNRSEATMTRQSQSAAERQKQIEFAADDDFERTLTSNGDEVIPHDIESNSLESSSDDINEQDLSDQEQRQDVDEESSEVIVLPDGEEVKGLKNVADQSQPRQKKRIENSKGSRNLERRIESFDAPPLRLTRGCSQRGAALRRLGVLRRLEGKR